MGYSGVIVKDTPDGVVLNAPISQDVTPASTELAPATLGRRHRVAGMFFTLSADARVQFFSGGVPLTGNMHFPASGGMVEVDLGSLVVGTVNNNLSVTTTGGAMNGIVKIVTEAP